MQIETNFVHAGVGARAQLGRLDGAWGGWGFRYMFRSLGLPIYIYIYCW
jgi:hypothetical protein